MSDTFPQRTNTDTTAGGRQRHAEDDEAVIAEFIRACVHSVLYYRSVYPRESFEKCQLYGIVVYRNRHPDLVEYIDASLNDLVLMPLRGGRLLMEFQIPLFGSDGSMREMYRVMFHPGDGLPMGRDDWYGVRDDCRAALMRLHALSPRPNDDDGQGTRMSFRLQAKMMGERENTTLMAVVDDARTTVAGEGQTVPLRTIRLSSCTIVCMITMYDENRYNN